MVIVVKFMPADITYFTQTVLGDTVEFIAAFIRFYAFFGRGTFKFHFRHMAAFVFFGEAVLVTHHHFAARVLAVAMGIAGTFAGIPFMGFQF